MNKITILAIGTVFVISMIAITAFEAEAKPPAQAICLAENIQHWNKIIFEIDLGSPDRNVVAGSSAHSGLGCRRG